MALKHSLDLCNFLLQALIKKPLPLSEVLPCSGLRGLRWEAGKLGLLGFKTHSVGNALFDTRRIVLDFFSLQSFQRCVHLLLRGCDSMRVSSLSGDGIGDAIAQFFDRLFNRNGSIRCLVVLARATHEHEVVPVDDLAA